MLAIQFFSTSNGGTLHARGFFFSCKLKVIHFQTQYLGMSLICILASGTAILQAKNLLKLLFRNSCTMQVIFILKKKKRLC